MSNRGGIIALLIAFLSLSAYFLIRTWKVNQIRKHASEFATDSEGVVDPAKKQSYLDSLWKKPVFLGSTLENLSKQELGLGLDLQGGMSVILEVAPNEIIKSLTYGSRDPRINTAIREAQKLAVKSNENFVDLFAQEFKKLAPDTKLASIFSNSSNRDVITLNSTDDEVKKYVKGEMEVAFDNSFRVIQNRVDKFGVANPNLQKLPGTNRIQVELPGVDNPQRVRKLLSGSAKLEFCEVYDINEVQQSFIGLQAVLAQMDAEKLRGSAKNVASATDTSSNSLASQLTQAAGDSSKVDSAGSSTFANLFVSVPGGFGVRTKDTSKLNRILERPDVKTLFPADLTFLYDVKPFLGFNDQEEIVSIYMVKNVGNAPIEGDVVTNAKQDYDPMSGKPEVTMKMNTLGARKWKELTAKNIGRRVAIILDKEVYSAPNVNQEIDGGSSSISGGFDIEEAIDLANVLKSGKLPAPANIIEEAIVGASVGSDAVRAGVLSSVMGLLAVLAFVLLYYNQAGWIANVALLVNLVLLLGIMASFGATLTLPGIAGMVLSVGMAVDANVLIYERVKEELVAGKAFPLAISNGFKYAMPSIIDSNVTTLITGVILFIFGTGLVLGFATTLLIGIFTSLFCAIFVSRLIFDYYIKKGKTIKFFTKWTDRLFNNTNLDFVKSRRVFYGVSLAIIIAGAISIAIKGFGLGVDFKGGRTYVAKFEKNVSTDDVRNVMQNVFDKSPVEVKTFGGNDQVKITTPYKIDISDPAVEKEIEEKINTALLQFKDNPGAVVSSTRVGPTIANTTIRNAIWAIILSIAVTFVYIYFRFKSVAFGVGAVVALFHDVLIILGIFSIFNGLLPFSLDVDQAFVGAVLTLMGYSMNDTVVVFDRVREYLRDTKNDKEPIEAVINKALNSTLSRTAVTGVATLIVLFVLLIFGGETIRGFIFAMFLGVIVGTYSSLYIAAPIVVDWLQGRLTSKKKTELKPA